MKRICQLLIVGLLLCVLTGCKEPSYYRDKIIVNGKEYQIKESKMNDEGILIEPSTTIIKIDVKDELEIKLASPSYGNTWIIESKGLKLVSEETDLINKNPFREVRSGETNLMSIYKYKVTNSSQISLRIKDIYKFEYENYEDYDHAQYEREIIFVC